MKWDIDPSSRAPIARQLADNVRAQVALGRLKPDERLPAIRGLAAELGMDPGTVARAYRELELDGTIVTRRGMGSFVAPHGRERYLADRRKDRLAAVVERAVLEALGLGFTVEDIETAFTLNLASWRERRSPAPEGKSTRRAREERTIRFVGSHDLAVELLARHVSTLQPGVRLATRFVGSLSGLVAVARGEADVAGAHLLDEQSGVYNLTFVKTLMPNEHVTLIHLVQRIQGLIVPPGNPRHILSVRDLARPDITFVNRQKGSGTRILLDAELRRLGMAADGIKGYSREETTHSAVAAAVAVGEADVGLGAQSATGPAGLDFIPLVKEHYDLIMLSDTLEKAPFSLVPEVVQSEIFREMLGAIPGYDISETGKLVSIVPNR